MISYVNEWQQHKLKIRLRRFCASFLPLLWWPITSGGRRNERPHAAHPAIPQSMHKTPVRRDHCCSSVSPTFPMSIPQLRLSLIGLIVTCIGNYPAQSQRSPPTPTSSTNRMVIHLQEGFHGNHQATVSVDNREAYSGTPKTTWGTGLAAVVCVTNASACPVVVFRIPDSNVAWSNRVDLLSGSALGISVGVNGALRVLQSTNFFYD